MKWTEFSEWMFKFQIQMIRRIYVHTEVYDFLTLQNLLAIEKFISMPFQSSFAQEVDENE